MIIYRILITLIVLLPIAGYGQGFINQSKKRVLHDLEKQAAAIDTINTLLSETDSSIHYSFRDEKLLPADFIYHFDRNDKCNAEIVIASCDSCFNKYLQRALARTKFGWKKLKENLYVSGFAQKMMLEIPAGNIPHSFIIRKMKWDRRVYNTLVSSK